MISGAAIFASSRFLTEGWAALILNIAIFVAVYGITLLLFGFTKEEKKKIPIINKLFR